MKGGALPRTRPSASLCTLRLPNPFNPVQRGRKGVVLPQHAVSPSARVILDEEAISRTLSRIAHEVIERNEDLDTVALVGIWSRGVPIARRLHRLIEERSGESIELGQLDITFHRDDVHVRAGRRRGGRSRSCATRSSTSTSRAEP